MNPINPTSLIIVTLLLAMVTDLRSQRIPNLLTFPAILTALILHTAMNGVDGFFFSFLGTATGIGVLLAPYLLGGMGAGDTKLMGAVGAAVGFKGVFLAFLFTALFGGIYAFGLIVVKRKLFKGFFKQNLMKIQLFLMTRQYIPDRKKTSTPRLCYGIAIAAGSFTYIFLNLSGYV